MHVTKAQCYAAWRCRQRANLRRIAAEKGRDLARELRWSNGHKWASLRIAGQLFWLGEPRTALLESLKTLGAMMRESLATYQND